MKTLKEFIEALPCMVMRFWQDLLDSFSSDGGHILLLLLIVGAMVFVDIRWHVDKVMDIALQAFGALLLILKDVGSNKTRRDRPTPTTETTAATVTTTAKIEDKQP